MSGGPDSIYALARRTLLDALYALGAHSETVVLIGAQAVYLHTGDTDLSTAPFTTDADFAVDPAELSESPLIDKAMAAGGFKPRNEPGGWISKDNVYVDLLVPESLAQKGRRSVGLGPHGRRARSTSGLEGVLIDRKKHTIYALENTDERRPIIWVAGPAALLVAKIHKIEDRIEEVDNLKKDRTSDKDTLDVLRLMRAIPTADLAERLAMLRETPLAASATDRALRQLPAFFGTSEAPGVRMAVAASDGDDPDFIAASLVALATDLVDACG